MTPDQPTSESVEPDAIFHSDGTRHSPEPAVSAEPAPAKPPRTLYWHVFGAPLEGKKGGKKNYLQVTAGPVTRGPEADVTETTIEGSHGELLAYQGTFTQEPTTRQLVRLRPEAYRK